jgi:hypothetical protein
MKLYEILERNAFLNEDDSEHIWNLPASKVEQMYDALYSELRLHQYDGVEGVKSSFSFVASASIRAATGCQYPRCVRQKLEFLAHYASLYCDLVFLPLPLSGERTDSVPEKKAALEECIRSVGILRPVIEAGLVRPVTMTTSHCMHILPLVKRVSKFALSAAVDLQSRAMGEFAAVYQKPECSPTGRPTVYIEGPEDLMEHGELVGLYGAPPFWVSKSWRYDSEGKHVVPTRKLRRISRINQIFENIADDTSFHLAFGSPFQARYLTDLPGEAAILQGLADDPELVAANEAVRKMLSHIIPVVGDLSLRAVIRLRKTEQEAFSRYRDALTRIIDEFLRGHKRLTKKDADEIFHDCIESELRRIRQLITSKRKSAAKQFAAGAAGLFASVAVGAFSLPVPPPVVTAVQAGSALLLGHTARECLSHSEERTNDFYFLLRLKQAGGWH